LDSSEGAHRSSDDASGTTVADTTTTTADPSTATGTTSDSKPFCGDGHVDPDLLEECDDGEVVSDTCVWCQRPRLIFLTSTLLKGGKINGLTGADAYCRSLALKAQQEVPDSPIVDPTNFKALLSSSTESIADRHFFGKGPYRLVNGLTVANKFADLFNGTQLINPINVNERSETMHFNVWTGTATDGTPYPGITYCGDWNEVTGTANYGRSDSVDVEWIDAISDVNPDSDCYGNRPIYCAEQE
jgi:cysteine-rich repeat protein